MTRKTSPFPVFGKLFFATAVTILILLLTGDGWIVIQPLILLLFLLLLNNNYNGWMNYYADAQIEVW